MAAALSLTAFIKTLGAAGGGNMVDIAITRPDGTSQPLKVELALTPEQQSQGLMYRTSLKSGQGMLFIYDKPTNRAFWMKNTLIPLDMLFFDKRGQLVFIYPRARPRSLAPIGPDRSDICMVLELGGGEAKRLNLNLGDKLFTKHASDCLQ